jgi:hypothetical protein
MRVTPSKPDLKSAMYVGIAVTAVLFLLPRIGDFFIIAFLLGAFSAVLFAIRSQKQVLEFKDGADLGFLSGFYGLLTAGAIYGVVWKFFHYQLWQIKNVDRLLSLLSDWIRDMFSPAAWLVITIQMIVYAILAGMIAVPAGLLAVKIFQRSSAN